MKKIILSIGTIIFAGAIVVAATGAFFSDAETSTGNTFTAGDIDLQIDNTSYVTDANGVLVASASTSWDMKDLVSGVDHFFNFSDLKPGDIGEDTISIHVGSNNAWMCAAARITDDSDQSCTDPELADDPTCTTPGLGQGELDSQVNFAFWHDDGDNVLEEGEQSSIFLQGPLSAIGAQGQIRLADSSGGILGANTPIPGNTTFYIGKAWCFGTLAVAPVAQGADTSPLVRGTGFTCDGASVNNAAQTDQVMGDMQFYAVQARNNATFTCAQDYRPTWEGATAPTTKVGALLSAYVAPTVNDCTGGTVTGAGSIQTAINAASVGQTVCVDSTYTGAGDNVAIRINEDNVTLAATVRGVNLDVPVVLDNSGTKVTGFDGVIGQAESPAEQAAFYIDGDAQNVTISFNTVTGGTGAGVLTETGGTNNGGLITNNVLSGATQGIYINPHTGVLTIEYNDIDNNVAGIAGLMGALVRYNEFEHTTSGSEAIGADSTYDSNPATVNFNNFLNGTMLNTYGAIAGDVSAENNFWGPNGGATQTGGTDEVDFTPEAGAQYAHN